MLLQQDLGQTCMSKAAMCHDHFFAIVCIFSGIFLVNSMLIGLAANTLYNSGFVFLTLQDALSLLDQVGFVHGLSTSTKHLLVLTSCHGIFFFS